MSVTRNGGGSRVWAGLYLDCTVAGPLLIVSYERALSEHFGLRMRRTELKTRLRSTLKKLGRVSQHDDHSHVHLVGHVISRATLVRFMEALEQRISVVASRPFPSSQVESLLGISASERLRWTKQGYLRPEGREQFQRGQSISVCCYPVGLVSDLVANPEIVSGWRAANKISTNQD